jgi:hypothetical protein
LQILNIQGPGGARNIDDGGKDVSGYYFVSAPAEAVMALVVAVGQGFIFDALETKRHL